MQQVALNVNLDSLRTILAHKSHGGLDETLLANDPCFFAVTDRFVSLAQQYQIPLTFYVVGRDLEHPRIARRVRELHSLGHEIGNHSYSHVASLGQLPKEEIDREVTRGHAAIAAALGGHEPSGFIAPAWCTSPDLLAVLVRRGYAYDTSLFPSFLMPLTQLRLKLGSIAAQKGHFSVVRKDLWGNLAGSTRPFVATPTDPWGTRKRRVTPGDRGIVCLPLPTVAPRIGFWHSWAFRISPRRYESWLRRAIHRNSSFYLLTHPADLFDPARDAKGFPSSLLSFERMDIPLEAKLDRMRLALDVICSQCQVVRMRDLAASVRERMGP